MKTMVIAIGGNAILKNGQKGTFSEQMDNINECVGFIVSLIKAGYNVVLTHGNGPQVGNILIQQDMAKEIIPTMDIDVCVANTQGQIGFMLTQGFKNALNREGIVRNIVTVLTHVEVSGDDTAFDNPTKPIGPFYSLSESESLAKEKGYTMVEDSGRGYRRVVPSPMPISIMEEAVVRELARDNIVIACGGGGIPVTIRDGVLLGVPAVIDKDFASSLLASKIGADYFVLLTGVPEVYVDFGKPTQRAISKMSLKEAYKYLEEGQFPKGSMEPKILAALKYIENGGNEVIITSIDKLEDALIGKIGTRIVKA